LSTDPNSNEKVPHAAQPRLGATVVVAITRPAFLGHKLVLLGIALFTAFIVLTVPKFFTETRSAQWPSAVGIVTQSRLRVGYFKQMQGFIPDIQYHYTVGEREFTGTQTSGRHALPALSMIW
jgi:hypothetical protein